MKTTRAFVQMEAHGPLELREITLPNLRPHDIDVDITSGGICHSQLNWMELSRDRPMVFGHEAVGRVRDVGSEVRKVRIGDAVLLTWIADTDSLERVPIPSTAELSDQSPLTTAQIFTWAERTIIDENFVMRLVVDGTPDPSLSILGCAIPTGLGAVMNSARVLAGDTVVVIGTGGVGLSVIKGAKLSGASRVIAVDISDEKLEFSMQFGATDLINSAAENLPEAVHQLLENDGVGKGADFVFDCVASPSTFAQAVASVRANKTGRARGGSVVLVGYPMKELTLDGAAFLRAEKSILASFGGSCGHDHLAQYLGLWENGEFDFGQLVTDTYAFEDIPAGVEALRSGRVTGRAVYTI